MYEQSESDPLPNLYLFLCSNLATNLSCEFSVQYTRGFIFIGFGQPAQENFLYIEFPSCAVGTILCWNLPYPGSLVQYSAGASLYPGSLVQYSAGTSLIQVALCNTLLEAFQEAWCNTLLEPPLSRKLGAILCWSLPLSR